MFEVRLITYKANGDKDTEEAVRSLISTRDAAEYAARMGVNKRVDFAVIEPKGSPLCMYWSGQATDLQKLEEGDSSDEAVRAKIAAIIAKRCWS